MAKITGGAVPVEQWGVFESEDENARDLALGEEPADEAPPESTRTGGETPTGTEGSS